MIARLARFRARSRRPLGHALALGLSALAFLWRRLMFRTTFIAITGSVGKTTAAESLGAMLAAHYPTNWARGGGNNRRQLALNILRTRFRHRFTVIEVGTRRSGALRRASWMIAPDIAVVLRVLLVHSNVFSSLDAVAQEKSQLLGRLGPQGIAVLNGDDPLVMAMGAGCPGTVRTFGMTPGTFLTASEVSSSWPQRLSFRATCGGQSCRVQTNFVGEQFLSSALAVLTVAVLCGVPLEQAAADFHEIHAVAGRMNTMVLPNGATVLRDEFNSSYPTILAGLEVLRHAKASRRIVIVGDVLDSGMTVRPRFRDIGRRTAEVADMAVFLGYDGRAAVKAAVAAGMAKESAWAFKSLPEAAAFLQSELRSGDLVLLEGWIERHVERLVLAQTATIACWKERCTKLIECERCPELLVSLDSSRPGVQGGSLGA